jgi:hypothetical protein
VRVAFGESGELGGIKPRVHASEDGKVSRRRHSELAFIAKVGAVFLVGCKYFLKNFAHNGSLVEELRNTFVLSKVEERHPKLRDFGSESLWISRQRKFAFGGNYRSNSNRIGGGNS